MISLRVQVTDTATPKLAELTARLRDRQALHGAVAAKEEVMFREYLRGQASLRHKSARALDAQPTGEMERAAQSPEGTATSSGAQIALKPGHLFARTFQDVEIRPSGGKKYLTIPAATAAYGRRAGQFGGSLRFLRVGPNKTPVLALDTGNSTLQTMYRLVARVRQKQDRTLLPPDADITQTAEEAAKDYIMDEGGATV